jgi:hypothetical protein
MMDERMFWFPLPSDPAMTELERQTSPMNADGMISTPTQVTPELPPESPGISALAESLSPTTTICSSDNANLLLHDKRVCTYKRRGAESCIECYATSVYFPVIMHRMISQMCTVDASLMHWCDEGKHFWISQRSCSLSDVLKVYFKRTNMCTTRVRETRNYRQATVLTILFAFQMTAINRSGDSSTPTNS